MTAGHSAVSLIAISGSVIIPDSRFHSKTALKLTVRVLGGIAIEADGELLQALPARRLRCALLLYVIIERRVSRASLIEVFWPDRDPARARHVLNQTLYQLRQEIGSEWVATHGGALEVTTEVELDLERFERLAGSGMLDEALSIYRGPFLGDFGTGPSLAFEHWADRIRGRAERSHRKVRRDAIAKRLANGETDHALSLAREWVAADPTDDEANHHCVELLALTGRRAEGLRQFELYRARLRNELGVDPLDDTLALVERIRAGAATPSSVESLPSAGGPPPPPVTDTARPSDSAADVPAATVAQPAVHRLRPVAVALSATVVLMITASWLRTLSGRGPQPDPVRATGLAPSVIAILPFEVWTPEPALDAAAFGLREAIALDLHRIEGLDVVSNPAVRRLAQPTVLLDSVAARFGAGIVISGSVQRLGARVRVVLGVTDMTGMEPYHTSSVEADDSALQRLQDDVVIEIQAFLRPTVGERIEAQRRLPRSVSRPAWVAYNRGRQLVAKVADDDATGTSVVASLRQLDIADSLFTDAQRLAADWSAPALARGWSNRDRARLEGTTDTARYVTRMQRAIAIARSVLARVPTDAEAHELAGTAEMHLGFVLGSLEMLAQAEADLLRSVEYDPKRASTWRSLSFLVLQRGRPEEAETYAGRALAEDPFDLESASLIHRMATTMRSAQRVAEADAWCARGIREHPADYRFAECVLANAAQLRAAAITTDSAERLMRKADALDAQPSGRPLSYRPLYRRALFATVLLRTREADSARAVMDRVVRAAAGRPDLERPLDYDLAWFELLAGDTAAATATLHRYMQQNPQFRAYAERDTRWGKITAGASGPSRDQRPS